MKKIKVLIIDDEEDLLSVMELRVKSWGYEVITASRGKEGVSLVESENPDLVILDYMMPEMNGLATLREIRNINGIVPVIMFTSCPSMKTIKGAEELGVSAFVPKISLYSDSQCLLKEAIHLITKDKNGSSNAEGI